MNKVKENSIILKLENITYVMKFIYYFIQIYNTEYIF